MDLSMALLCDIRISQDKGKSARGDQLWYTCCLLYSFLHGMIQAHYHDSS
jgi:hypothetical protein